MLCPNGHSTDLSGPEPHVKSRADMRGWVQVFEAAMNAGAEDIQRATSEEGVLEGFKARRASV